MKAERPRASTRVEMQVSTLRSKKEYQREHEQETRSQSTRWVGRGVQRQGEPKENCKMMAEEGHEVEGKASCAQHPALKIRAKIEIGYANSAEKKSKR
jgi:hypothetical protein